MTHRPHSFQSVADRSSSDGTAGPSVVERSEGPAPLSCCPYHRSGGHPENSCGDDTISPWVPPWRPDNLMRDLADDARRSHRKRVVDGYDSHDIDWALRGIENALPFALAAFRCHLENNEHVMSFVDFQGFANRLTDLVADELRGPLMKRMDEMRGDR